MIHPHIYFKSDKTGRAWYHYQSGMDVNFDNNTQWKIYGQVYVANTGRFRDVWNDAMQDWAWDTINKKGP